MSLFKAPNSISGVCPFVRPSVSQMELDIDKW